VTASPPAALDSATVPEVSRTGYPEPYRGAVAGRSWRALGDPFGLTDFGVNLVRLEPGAASSQRHWHSDEDELVYVLEGEPTLVTDAGPQRLRPGMVAGFAKDRPDGHHLRNETASPVLFLVVGSRREGDACFYPDVDLQVGADGVYRRKSGEAW
jgi:uncharacterized cupin superfamily protein